MDTEVVQREKKRARRVRVDEDVEASQPREYTSKVRRKSIALRANHCITELCAFRSAARPQGRASAAAGSAPVDTRTGAQEATL